VQNLSKGQPGVDIEFLDAKAGGAAAAEPAGPA
jgi:hypothetical protein